MASELQSAYLDQIPQHRDLSTHYAALLGKLAGLRTSRRQVLFGIAGAAAGLPLSGTLARAASHFETRHSDTRFELLVGGQCVWQVDCDWFDGTPRLQVKRHDGFLQVQLSEALFPGTRLAADFDLTATRSGSRWSARLCFPALAFASDFPFETWMLGYQRSESPLGLSHVAFTQAPELRLEQLSGTATFGPDWIFDIDLPQDGRLRIGPQHATVASLRLELPAAHDNRDRIRPSALHIWPCLAGDTVLKLETPDKGLELPLVGAAMFIASSRKAAVLMLAQAGDGARLLWKGNGMRDLAAPAHKVRLNLHYTAPAPTISGTADLAPATWHPDQHFSAEFSMPPQIPLASASPGQTPAPASTAACNGGDALPVARRFVVSVPGCDWAMFSLRDCAGTGDAPEAIGGGLFQFRKHDIQLDGYDLTLRRAADALALTVRFRHIRLVYTMRGWALFGSKDDDSLIEFDFGPQHLLEEAVYLTQWYENMAKGTASKPPPELLAIPAEIAALAILRDRIDSNGTPPSPVSPAKLLEFPNESYLAPLLDYLNDDTQRPLFLAFRKNPKLRDRLGKEGQTGGTPKVQPARPSHLTFGFHAPDGLRFEVGELLAWSAKRGPAHVYRAGSNTYKPRLSPRAAAIAPANGKATYASLGADDQDPNRPFIERPASLAQTDGKGFASAIEVPARLVMSPVQGDPAQWQAPQIMALPRAEVWSVRMSGTRVRAIYTPDARPLECAGAVCAPCALHSDRYRIDIFRPPTAYAPGAHACEFRASLDMRDRHELVVLSSLTGFATLSGPSRVNCGGTSPATDGGFTATPIDVALLQLSSLGANFKYRGLWTPPAAPLGKSGALSVTRYDHDGQQGRDVLARVEYKGFLFPLGLPAILIKLTERRFAFELSKTGKLQSVARLVQRFFIHVPAFTRTFPAEGQPNEHRLWGHVAIHIDEVTTPDLGDPSDPAYTMGNQGQGAFWPRNLQNALIEFPFGEPATSSAFLAPLVFVDNFVAHSAVPLRAVMEAWRKQTHELLKRATADWPRTTAPGVAKVTSGRLPYVVGRHGDNTDLQTDLVILDVQNRLDVQVSNTYSYAQYDARDACDIVYQKCPGNAEQFSWLAWGVTARMEAQTQPPFYPVRRRARVTLGTVSVLTGAGGRQHLLDFDQVYAARGLAADANPGQVYGRFVCEAPVMDFGANTAKSGAFASPSTAVVYMTVPRGPVGGNRQDLIPLVAPAETYTPAQDSTCPIHAFDGTVTKTQSTLEIGNAHANNFVPTEFFSGFLGEAKLLGVVRIVDVLQVALAASRTSIPTITSETLLDLAEATLRPLVPRVRDALKDLLDRLLTEVPSEAILARITPALSDLQRQLDDINYLLAASQVDQAQLLAQVRAFGNSIASLSQSVQALANEPEALLPPDVAEVVNNLKPLLAALQDGHVEQLLASELRAVVGPFVDAAIASSLAALRQEIDNNKIQEIYNNKNVEGLRTSLESVQAGVDRIEHALEEQGAHLAADLNDALWQVLDAVDEFNRLYALLQQDVSDARDLVRAIHAAVDTVVATYTGVGAALDALRQNAANTNVAISQAIARAEQQLSSLGLDPDHVAAAHRLLAGTRRAATGLSDAITECIANLAALPHSAPVGGSLSSVDNVILQLRFVAGLPANAIRQVDRVTEALDALVAYGTLAAKTSPNLLATLCDDAIAHIAQALDDFRQQVETAAGAPGLASVAKAVTTLQAAAVQLKAIAAMPAATRLGITNYISQLQRELDVASQTLVRFAAALQPGAQPLFLSGPACKAAGTDISAAARKLHAEFAIELAVPRRIADQLATILAYASQADAKLKQVHADCAAKLESARTHALATLATMQEKLCKPLHAVATHAVLSPEVQVKLNRYLGPQLLAALDDLKRAVLHFIEICPKGDRHDIAAVEAATRRIGEPLRRALSIEGIGNLINVSNLLRDLQAMLGVPSRVRISYDWSTNLHEFPAGDSALFEPLDSRKLTIHAVVEAGLQGGAPSASMIAEIDRFQINLFGRGSSQFLMIQMDKLTLELPPGGSLRCKTKVLEVLPGPALGFVQNLSELLGFDSGFLIFPTFNGILVRYEFRQDATELGGFFVQNIAFAISTDLPFDNSPVRVQIQLSDKITPFLISAGIYGGGGFFGLATRADTLEVLEASFEFGVVCGFSFGPLTGSGRITAGVYIRLGGRAPTVEGFFCAVGEVSLARLFHAGASLRVTLNYQVKEGNMHGIAEYEFHFSVGWIKYKYSVSVDYTKSGDSAGGSDQGSRLTTERTTANVAGTLPRSNTSDERTGDYAYSQLAWERLWRSMADDTMPPLDIESSCVP